jgi:hypothetical protein
MESIFVKTKAITQLDLIPEASFVSKCGTMTCYRGKMDVQVQPIHVLGTRKGLGSAPYLTARVGTQFPLLCPHLYFGVALTFFKPLYVIRGPSLH